MNDKILAVLDQISKTVPGRLITRENDLPYLFRYYLAHVDSGDASVFLHKFVASDKLGEIHSHPWDTSLSIILSGKYIEHRARADRSLDSKRVYIGPRVARVFEPGHMNLIEADDFHRVELLTPEVWTLFIHGKRITNWGFVPEEFDATHDVRIVEGRTFDRQPEVNRPIRLVTENKVRQPAGRTGNRPMVECEKPGFMACHYEDETCPICRDPDITRKIRL